ncbi:hypothetical protein R3P38DRAFT_2808336 [Favolaschia claudopus]|uniref:Uncharacterized protein n=1 Tax=Favolaschia claudopus TaxID=2862362 RepID=A0AAV9ZG63_9AGAR
MWKRFLPLLFRIPPPGLFLFLQLRMTKRNLGLTCLYVHPAPGKIPDSYISNDDYGLEYVDDPQLTVQAQLDDNAEIPPALIPPGSNEFVADVAAAVSSTTETSGGWERPLKDAPSTRSGRKRRVYDTSNTLSPKMLSSLKVHQIVDLPDVFSRKSGKKAAPIDGGSAYIESTAMNSRVSNNDVRLGRRLLRIRVTVGELVGVEWGKWTGAASPPRAPRLVTAWMRLDAACEPAGIWHRLRCSLGQEGEGPSSLGGVGKRTRWNPWLLGSISGAYKISLELGNGAR